MILIVKKLLKIYNDYVQSETLARMNRGFSVMTRSVGWKVVANVALFVFTFKGIFINWNHPKAF